MGLLEMIGKLFSGSPSDQKLQGDVTYDVSDFQIQRVRKQGINPMVRDADDDYRAVETSYRAANRLARDVAR